MCNLCSFCGNVQTLAHILAGCSTALEQGRYTWRHDSILMTIITFVKMGLRPGWALFSDLHDYQASQGGVIPPHILVTPLKPNLFLIDEEKRTIIVFQLTCLFERNIDHEHLYKAEKSEKKNGPRRNMRGIS